MDNKKIINLIAAAIFLVLLLNEESRLVTLQRNEKANCVNPYAERKTIEVEIR